MKEGTDLIAEAGDLAKCLYNKHEKDIERGKRMAAEYLILLADTSYIDEEIFSDYHGLLIEIACVMADPKISGKITEVYYQKRIGLLLKRMIRFFQSLEMNSDTHTYLTWFNLENFSGSMERKELADIKSAFSL